MCIHTHTHIYIYIYICIYTCINVYIYIYIYIHTYIYTYIHIYIYTYIHIWLCVYIYIYREREMQLFRKIRCATSDARQAARDTWQSAWDSWCPHAGMVHVLFAIVIARCAVWCSMHSTQLWYTRAVVSIRDVMRCLHDWWRTVPGIIDAWQSSMLALPTHARISLHHGTTYTARSHATWNGMMPCSKTMWQAHRRVVVDRTRRVGAWRDTTRRDTTRRHMVWRRSTRRGAARTSAWGSQPRCGCSAPGLPGLALPGLASPGLPSLACLSCPGSRSAVRILGPDVQVGDVERDQGVC